VVENVSLVRNYRSQFSHIINKSSYEGLVQAIKKKLKELDASSSSITTTPSLTAGLLSGNC
jgi:hypothetical protein